MGKNTHYNTHTCIPLHSSSAVLKGATEAAVECQAAVAKETEWRSRFLNSPPKKKQKHNLVKGGLCFLFCVCVQT